MDSKNRFIDQLGNLFAAPTKDGKLKEEVAAITKAIKERESKSYAELMRDKDFEWAITEVKKVKRQIERIAGHRKAEQPKESLSYLIGYRKNMDFDHVNVMLQLTKACLVPHWSDRNKKWYDEHSEKVANWCDFFLSYTNRNVPGINLNCKKAIKPLPKKIRKEEWDRRNVVATLIAQYLVTYNLTGFFDVDKLKCGDELKEKVLEYCTKAHAFIQLVEDECFTKERDKTNWCFFEYDRFRNHNVNEKQKSRARLYFLPAGLTFNEENYANMVPDPYHDWFRVIMDKRYLSIHGADHRELKKKIFEIVSRIKASRNKEFNLMLERKIANPK